MKKRLLVLLCAALHQFLPLPAQHSDTLYPVADIYIRTLGGGDGHSSFLKFDISSIPNGNTIDSVTLEVFIYEKSVDYDQYNDMTFMRMNHQTWVESSNDTIQLTDTVIQEDGFGADSGWNCSNDLTSLILHDYSLSNSFFTVVLKDSNDRTIIPPDIEYPNDRDDSLLVGMLPKYILFYAHESSHDSLIPRLIINYTIVPEIISQSGDSTKCESDSVSFYVSATGDPPLSYQWQKDGVIVPDGADSLLSISSITLDMAGNYRCIVSNNGGYDTSAIMVLTVNALPTVVIQGPDTACGSALLDEGFGIPGDLYL